MKKLSNLDTLAIVLVIIGGLNWGLVGAFDYNLVTSLFGKTSTVSQVIFVLVGLAALYVTVILGKLSRKS